MYFTLLLAASAALATTTCHAPSVEAAIIARGETLTTTVTQTHTLMVGSDSNALAQRQDWQPQNTWWAPETLATPTSAWVQPTTALGHDPPTATVTAQKGDHSIVTGPKTTYIILIVICVIFFGEAIIGTCFFWVRRKLSERRPPPHEARSEPIDVEKGETSAQHTDEPVMQVPPPAAQRNRRSIADCR